LGIEHEALIRPAFMTNLRSLLSFDAEWLVIEELGVENGAARIDVAAVGSSVFGFEIKAAADSLGRLHRQVEHYDRLVDYAYLVCTENHTEGAQRVLPEGWGIIVTTAENGEIRFSVERPARRNLNRHAESLARLLWRGEVLAVLGALGLDRGVKRKSAKALHCHLATCVGIDQLGEMVLDRLLRRESWGTRLRQPTYMEQLTATGDGLPSR
jgi:hypothetical protein